MKSNSTRVITAIIIIVLLIIQYSYPIPYIGSQIKDALAGSSSPDTNNGNQASGNSAGESSGSQPQIPDYSSIYGVYEWLNLDNPDNPYYSAYLKTNNKRQLPQEFNLENTSTGEPITLYYINPPLQKDKVKLYGVGISEKGEPFKYYLVINLENMYIDRNSESFEFYNKEILSQLEIHVIGPLRDEEFYKNPSENPQDTIIPIKALPGGDECSAKGIKINVRYTHIGSRVQVTFSLPSTDKLACTRYVSETVNGVEIKIPIRDLSSYYVLAVLPKIDTGKMASYVSEAKEEGTQGKASGYLYVPVFNMSFNVEFSIDNSLGNEYTLASNSTDDLQPWKVNLTKTYREFIKKLLNDEDLKSFMEGNGAYEWLQDILENRINDIIIVSMRHLLESTNDITFSLHIRKVVDKTVEVGGNIKENSETYTRDFGKTHPSRKDLDDYPIGYNILGLLFDNANETLLQSLGNRYHINSYTHKPDLVTPPKAVIPENSKGSSIYLSPILQSILTRSPKSLGNSNGNQLGYEITSLKPVQLDSNDGSLEYTVTNVPISNSSIMVTAYPINVTFSGKASAHLNRDTRNELTQGKNNVDIVSNSLYRIYAKYEEDGERSFTAYRNGGELNHETQDTAILWGYSKSGFINTSSHTEEKKEGDKTITYLVKVTKKYTYEVTARLQVKLKEATVYIKMKTGSIKVKPKLSASIKKIKLSHDLKLSLIPSLAPMGGAGFPTYLSSTISQLGMSDVATSMDNVVNNIFGNPIVGAVMPTYFPTPLPSEDVSYVSPGEYMGVYFFSNTTKIGLQVEDLKNPSIGNALKLFSLLGTSIVTIFYEKVNVSLVEVDDKASNGNVRVYKVDKDGELSIETNEKKKPVNYATMYSLGLGFGEMNFKALGPRFYIMPSAGAKLSLQNGQSSETGFLDLNKIPILNSIFSSADDSSKNDAEDSSKEAMGIIEGYVNGLLKDLNTIGNQVSNYGVYPQLTCYLGGKKALWPYILFATKNNYRFAALSVGDYAFNATYNLYMVNLRILKVGVLPLPIPVFYSYGGSVESHKVHVRKMGVEPLFYSYSLETPDVSSGVYEGSVDIYAVPVWLNETGYPVAPVLFRGKYGNTGLSIVATTEDGFVLNSSDVYFFGVPLTMLKLRFNDLYSLIESGHSTLYLSPVWKVGKSFIELKGSNAFEPFTMNLYSVKTFVFTYDGKNALVYSGIYDDNPSTNKLLEIAEKASSKYSEFEEPVVEQINSASNNISRFIDELNSLNNILNSIEDEENKVYGEISNINENLVNYLNNIAIGIAKDIITQAMVRLATSIIVTLVLPVSLPSIDGIVSNLISDYIQKDDYSNAREVLMEFASNYTFLFMKYLGLKVAEGLLLNNGAFNQAIQTASQLAEDAYGMLDDTKDFLLLLSETLNNTVDIAKYKPLLLSNTIYVDPLTGNAKNVSGILNMLTGKTNITLAIDLLEVNESRGGVLYVKPYSPVSLILNSIMGGNDGEKTYLTIGFSGVLNYTAAWVNFLGRLLNSNTAVSVYTNLIDTSVKMNEYYKNKIEHYVVIPGVDTSELILPGYTVLPPSDI